VNAANPNAMDPNARNPNVQEAGNAKDPAAPGNAAGGPSPNRRRRGRRRSRSGAKDPARTPEAAPEAQNPLDDGPLASEGARKLAESLQEAVLRHTATAVLGRGQGYAKRNRVAEMRVSAGRVRARVRGSGKERYRVELTVPQRPAPAVVTKIRWSCDCPYAAEHRRGTCKHVVAVALVAAKRIERNDSMFQRWLGQPTANAAEAAPAELDALAERMLAAFTAQPMSVEEVLTRAIAIAPPPFDITVTRTKA
jgi:hypothetical protein